MEYSFLYDFYLIFKAAYNKDGNFIDYILVYISDNFYKAAKMEPDSILGKRISHIAAENLNKLGLKDIFVDTIPNKNRKFVNFIKELNRLYLISIFYENEENMIIFYSDLTDIRVEPKKELAHLKNYENNILYLNDRSRLYYKDTLTELYNKNFFEEELNRLNTKRQLPISIIVGDINGLKLINDAFGHGMGDKALKRVSKIMINSFRSEDIISRVGGDEFIVLLPKTSSETALSIIDRIKKSCEKNPLDFIKISISFGVATKETEDEDIYKVLKKAEEILYFNKLKESKEAKLEMIKFLKNKLEKITFETKAHYKRLEEFSLLMAEELCLSDTEKEELKLLCEFHDIGKIGISKNILQKEGILNKEEYESVKRHSEIGYYIAKELREVYPVDELILTHHERWDGSGYPGLFKNEEIPIVSRIFAIADAYDAMVNERPYKARISNEEALKEIIDKSGSQFDPNIAEVFVRIMNDRNK